MKLRNKELATVLAALRQWQNLTTSGKQRNIDEGLHFADCAPLSDKEIDELCERLNTKGE